MAQHDMNIANQGFPATRADLNNALQALVSNSSGATAPSTTFANQWWYDTTNNKLYIRNEANNAWIQVAVLDQTNNEWQITTGQISAGDSDGILFKTDDGTTRATLDDSGNFLVGAAAPTPGNGNTDTGHLLKSDGRLFSSSASNSQFNRNSEGDILTFRQSGTLVGSISSRGGVATNVILRTATGQGAGIGGANSGVLPCDEDGLQDNEINLGASGTRWKDLYLSGGAYLGGTGTSNKLDDYEEGTWTPAANFVTTAPSSGATTGTGVYTKVGNNITIWGTLNNINVTGAVGNIKITGIPFASKSNSTLALYCGTVRVSDVNIANSYLVCEVRDGESFIRMIEMIDNAAGAELTTGDFEHANSDIFFTLCYQTA